MNVYDIETVSNPLKRVLGNDIEEARRNFMHFYPGATITGIKLHGECLSMPASPMGIPSGWERVTNDVVKPGDKTWWSGGVERPAGFFPVGTEGVGAPTSRFTAVIRKKKEGRGPAYVYWNPGDATPDWLPEGCECLNTDTGEWQESVSSPGNWDRWPRRWPTPKPVPVPVTCIAEKSDQYKMVLSDGVVLKAVPGTGCDNCYWRSEGAYGFPCRNPAKNERHGSCGVLSRQDHISSIWVVDDEKDLVKELVASLEEIYEWTQHKHTAWAADARKLIERAKTNG